MSSRSGGTAKKKAATSGGDINNMSADKESGGMPANSENESGCIPLESRLIEIRDPSTGNIKQVPALDKRWAPSMNYMEFYLPSCKTLLEDENSLNIWLDCIEMYSKDLTWLLSVPHHQFWSVMVYSPEVPQVVLQSFLLRAPQWFDKEFLTYLEHDVIGPKYQEIFSLIFRVFMRLCTFKESKKDFISPITWASLLSDHQIMDVLKLQTLCSLYDSENNSVLPKMIDNVMRHCPKLLNCFRNLIPVIMSKSEEMTDELLKLIRESSSTNKWNLEQYEEILSFFLSTLSGFYKFVKIYPPAAETISKFPTMLTRLAMKYEPNCCKLWGEVVSHLPMLEERVMFLRILIIRLFRVTLAGTTINEVNTPNDPRIDKYLEVLTNCLDEKTFIRDYEKLFPFKQDVNTLLSRGVFIDETTIDYVANAISACFHACGEDYAVEKIVVDPLYDPNFDRQLLGACSLDVTGVELQSLVTQVKDILPDLPDSYVEVVLKHYGYQAEAAINALLEGSVPSRLDKYKNENYVQPLTSSSVGPDEIQGEDKELEKLASKLKIKDVDTEMEKFYSGKRRYGFEECNSKSSIMNNEELVELKPLIKNYVTIMQEDSIPERDTNSKSKKNVGSAAPLEMEKSYIDESLLPSIRDSIEYEDEYDDTYDEINVGMTEPDNIECQPLNQKLRGRQTAVDAEDDDEDESEEQKKKLDFCEDPAIIRARLERRREEKYHNNRRGPPPPSSGDVVGKAKGQGQEKDVLYARRQKNIHKDPGGHKKKRADFKRREF